MIKGISAKNIVLEDKIISSSIIIKDGLISDITFDKNDDFLLIPDDLYVVPGFIDVHIHGSNGKDAMTADINNYEIISNALLKEGITSYLLTTMTEDINNIKKVMVATKEYNSISRSGAKILGIHLEGPFISKNYKGSQNEKYILEPNVELLKELNELSNNLIKKVTYAPEHDLDYKFLKYMLQNNIVPSIGHSDASVEIFDNAIRNGLINVTHLYNAQRKINNRDAGITGKALISDETYTEIICDLRHLSKEIIELIFRCKPKDKIVLVTDASEGKNIDTPTFKLGSNICYRRNGVAELEDGTIAASLLKLNEGLKNIKNIIKNYTFNELINLVTINPARSLNIDSEIGSIKKGKIADLTVIDKDFNVFATIINGEIVYNNLNKK